MGNKGDAVFGFDHLGRLGEGRVGIAGVFGHRPCARQQIGGGLGVAGAVVIGAKSVVPQRVEPFARRFGVPPAFGQNSHARTHAVHVVGAIDSENLGDAGLLLDRVEVGRLQFGTEHRGLDEDGVLHAGQDHIDAEQGLCVQHKRAVDPGLGLADNGVGLGVLERDRLQVRRRQFRGGRRQLNIAGLAAGSGVMDLAFRRRQFPDRHIPLCGGGGQHQGTTGGADAAHRLPVAGRRGRTARRLLAVASAIDRGGFDAHLTPIDVELLGDQHRQRGLDALADLRIARHQRHRIVGIDRDVIAKCDSDPHRAWRGAGAKAQGQSATSGQ